MLVKLTCYIGGSKEWETQLVNLDLVRHTGSSDVNGVFCTRLWFTNNNYVYVKESIDDILMFDNFKSKPDNNVG